MHVVEPMKYPLAERPQYTPSTFTLGDAMRFEKSVGVRNIVLVQPSIYGTDNSCLLAALRELGADRGRGVLCAYLVSTCTPIIEAPKLVLTPIAIRP